MNRGQRFFPESVTLMSRAPMYLTPRLAGPPPTQGQPMPILGNTVQEQTAFTTYPLTFSIGEKEKTLTHGTILFTVNDEPRAPRSATYTMVSLPHLNVTLATHWHKFDTIRRKIFMYTPNGTLTRENTDNRTPIRNFQEPLTSQDLKDIGGNQNKFERLLLTPAYMWSKDTESKTYLDNVKVDWLRWVDASRAVDTFKFAGIYSNRMHTEKIRDLSMSVVANVAIGGPFECVNVWGVVSPRDILKIVLTRPVAGGPLVLRPWHPWTEHGAPNLSTTPPPILTQFADATGEGVSECVQYVVGIMADSMGKVYPTPRQLEELRGEGQGGLESAENLKTILAAPIKIILGFNNHYHSIL